MEIPVLSTREKVVVGLWAVGALFSVISLASDEWNVFTNFTPTVTMGLWKMCGTICVSNTNIVSLYVGLKIARAFEVIGFISYILLAVELFVYKYKKDIRWLTWSAVMAFETGGIIILGAIGWVVDVVKINTNLSWGFYLCWLAGGLAISVGGNLIILRKEALQQGMSGGYPGAVVPPATGHPQYGAAGQVQGQPPYQVQGQPPYQGQPQYQGQPSYQGQAQPPYPGQGQPLNPGQPQPSYQGQPPYQAQGQPPYQVQPPPQGQVQAQNPDQPAPQNAPATIHPDQA